MSIRPSGTHVTHVAHVEQQLRLRFQKQVDIQAKQSLQYYTTGKQASNNMHSGLPRHKACFDVNSTGTPRGKKMLSTTYQIFSARSDLVLWSLNAMFVWSSAHSDDRPGGQDDRVKHDDDGSRLLRTKSNQKKGRLSQTWRISGKVGGTPWGNSIDTVF